MFDDPVIFFRDEHSSNVFGLIDEGGELIVICFSLLQFLKT